MVKTLKPEWVKINEEELKKLLKDLAEKHPPSVIGKILRDQYGIPSTKIVFGKPLSFYLKEMNLWRKEELENAKKKLEKMEQHMKKNPQDKKTKHKIQKALGKINSLKRYFNEK
ncbi:MAG: 30S ribosomal protein S15 [Candidatus Pacearchaeota archaeon]